MGKQNLRRIFGPLGLPCGVVVRFSEQAKQAGGTGDNSPGTKASNKHGSELWTATAPHYTPHPCPPGESRNPGVEILNGRTTRQQGSTV